jgi:hypothetical protein
VLSSSSSALSCNGRYMGGAFVTFKADKRQQLWDCVQGNPAYVPRQSWLHQIYVARMTALGGSRTQERPREWHSRGRRFVSD